MDGWMDGTIQRAERQREQEKRDATFLSRYLGQKWNGRMKKVMTKVEKAILSNENTSKELSCIHNFTFWK